MTTTTLVIEALKAADDLLTVRQLVTRTGRSTNQVFAALVHLRNHRVVDVVVQQEVSHWFATGDDNRQFHHDEYTEHKKPRRARAAMLKDRKTTGKGN